MPDAAQHICFFNTTTAWGGGEKWHLEMAEALLQKDYKVQLVAHPESELASRARQKNIPLHTFRIGNLSFLNPMKMRTLRSFFKQLQPDVLIMNLPSDLKAAGMAAKSAGIQRIIYRRGSDIPIKDKLLNRYLFSKVLDEVIANSEATKASINKKNPKLFPQKNIHVLYNGLHLPEKKDIPHGNNAIPVIGHAGRMVHQKGHQYMIEAAEILMKKGVDFEVRFAGTGPLEEELKAEVKQRGLEKQISFSGFVQDIPAFMQSIDVFALSSRWEGFGFVLAEAMAAARPLVAFDISSNPELVTHEQNGFLVKPFNSEELAERIEQLIADKELRQHFGQQGQDDVYTRFTFKKSLENFLTFLEH